MMNKEEIIKKTIDFVKETFKDSEGSHDFWHTYRVWKLATRIAVSEKDTDLFITELAALLHDVDDWKYSKSDDFEKSKAWLEEIGIENRQIEAIIHILENISFKGNGEENKISSLEGKIVQDADRIDAIGAIGIARVFAYGGSKGRAIYDPEKPFKKNMTAEEYMNNNGSSVNHFYEKLLLLKDRMNTGTGKKIAAERHKYLEEFLERFYKEWEGEL